MLPPRRAPADGCRPGSAPTEWLSGLHQSRCGWDWHIGSCTRQSPRLIACRELCACRAIRSKPGACRQKYDASLPMPGAPARLCYGDSGQTSSSPLKPSRGPFPTHRVSIMKLKHAWIAGALTLCALPCSMPPRSPPMWPWPRTSQSGRRTDRQGNRHRHRPGHPQGQPEKMPKGRPWI